MFRYFNLPPVPQELIDGIDFDISLYEKKWNDPNYRITWSDSHNTEINRWCQKNICEDMYFAFLIIEQDLPIHKDIDTLLKLSYVIRPGGDHVMTNFYNEDKTQQLRSVHIEPCRWHLLKTDEWHDVVGIEPNQFRFNLVGRVFP